MACNFTDIINIVNINNINNMYILILIYIIYIYTHNIDIQHQECEIWTLSG